MNTMKEKIQAMINARESGLEIVKVLKKEYHMSLRDAISIVNLTTGIAPVVGELQFYGRLTLPLNCVGKFEYRYPETGVRGKVYEVAGKDYVHSGNKYFHTENLEEVKEKSLLRALRRMVKEDKETNEKRETLAHYLGNSSLERQIILMHLNAHDGYYKSPRWKKGADDRLVHFYAIGENSSTRFYLASDGVNRYRMGIDEQETWEEVTFQKIPEGENWGYLGRGMCY